MMLIGAKLRVVPVTGHIPFTRSAAPADAGKYSNDSGR